MRETKTTIRKLVGVEKDFNITTKNKEIYIKERYTTTVHTVVQKLFATRDELGLDKYLECYPPSDDPNTAYSLWT